MDPASTEAFVRLRSNHDQVLQRATKAARQNQATVDTVLAEANRIVAESEGPVRDSQTLLEEEKAYDEMLVQRRQDALTEWTRVNQELAAKAHIINSERFREFERSGEQGEATQKSRGVGEGSRRRRGGIAQRDEEEEAYPDGAHYVDGMPTAQEIGTG